MKKVLKICGFVILLLPAYLFLSPGSTKKVVPVKSKIALTESNYTAKVSRVIDGDTIDVLIEGKNVRVRLIGINSPETVDPRKKVECFGKEASLELHRLIDGEEVKIETDPSQTLYDKYGRLLAYVFLLDGTNVNKQMVESGFAYEYTYNLPYKYQKEFKMAESSARLARRGLWADSACSSY